MCNLRDDWKKDLENEDLENVCELFGIEQRIRRA